MAKPSAIRCLTCVLMSALSLSSFALAQNKKEIYQDFRGNKPLLDEWKFIGSKSDKDGMRGDDRGLRITIPNSRNTTQPVGIRLKEPLSGDFELTGRYEVVSLEKLPPDAQPIGIAFNLATTNDNKNFAKLGRFRRGHDGDVLIAETWLKGVPVPVKVEPTTSDHGQLRLVRKGAKLSFQVAEGEGGFKELLDIDYTAEDLVMVRFGANNNKAPAAVDVRIIDVRLRPGVLAVGGAAPDPEPEAKVEPRSLAPGWLTAFTVIGVFVLVVLAVLICCVIYFVRRRRD